MTKEEMLTMKDVLTKEELSEMLDKYLGEQEQEKIEKWRVDNCFNEDWVTFVYFPADSYQKREELKRDMFHYHPIFKWHIAEVPMEYEDKVIPIKLSHLGEMMSYGKVEFYADAKTLVEERCAAVRPAATGEYIGVGEDKIYDYDVVYIRHDTISGPYGTSNLFVFEEIDGNTLAWRTSTFPDILFDTEGVVFKITGQIKTHKEFAGKKVTYLTRCKFKVAE